MVEQSNITPLSLCKEYLNHPLGLTFSTPGLVLHFRSNGDTSDFVTNVESRMFSNELYQPSFSSRSTFCESKFRDRTAKVYDGQEAPLGSFPWLASLQYKNKHYIHYNWFEFIWNLFGINLEINFTVFWEVFLLRVGAEMWIWHLEFFSICCLPPIFL